MVLDQLYLQRECANNNNNVGKHTYHNRRINTITRLQTITSMRTGTIQNIKAEDKYRPKIYRQVLNVMV